VYSKHSLLRAAALFSDLADRNQPLHLPDNIAGLVQAAYGSQTLGPAEWQEATEDAQNAEVREIKTMRSKAATFRIASPKSPGRPILGWLHAGVGEADETRQGRAQVRNGDDSIEVILLFRGPDSELHIPKGNHRHASEVIPTDRRPDDSLARAAAGCLVRLPAWITRGPNGDKVISQLERNGWFPEWQNNSVLAGQLVLPIDEVNGRTISGLRFRYDMANGLEVDLEK
jgi:hypothetical protein